MALRQAAPPGVVGEDAAEEYADSCPAVAIIDQWPSARFRSCLREGGSRRIHRIGHENASAPTLPCPPRYPQALSGRKATTSGNGLERVEGVHRPRQLYVIAVKRSSRDGDLDCQT